MREDTNPFFLLPNQLWIKQEYFNLVRQSRLFWLNKKKHNIQLGSWHSWSQVQLKNGKGWVSDKHSHPVKPTITRETMNKSWAEHIPIHSKWRPNTTQHALLHERTYVYVNFKCFCLLITYYYHDLPIE